MMDDSDAPSGYVRLTKDKEPLRDITPGELNQPLELHVRTCIECGQPLPERYEPPADEDWTTGICGCFDDTDSCRTGLFCPCVLFGHNYETLLPHVKSKDACVCHALCVEGGMLAAGATLLFHGIDPKTSFLIFETLVFSWWLCGIYNGMFRQQLQKKYHLKNSPCDPCMVHCCLHWCALCQEHREMKNHLSHNADMQMTIVTPPPVQEMNSNDHKQPIAADQHHPSPSSPSNINNINATSQHTNLEIQPV